MGVARKERRKTIFLQVRRKNYLSEDQGINDYPFI